jgi:2-methylcitrate dehydratase PrpD
MAKRVHAGRAAEGGLLAALLARGGVTGPAFVFQDVWGGFLATYAHAETDPGALTRDLGASWRIMQAAIKPYASCRDTHAAVDAVGRILERIPLSADEIAAVQVRLNAFHAGMVGGKDVETLPAAQMSLPYAIAARLAFGTAGLSAYTPERRADRQVRELLARVSIEVDESVVGTDRTSVALVTADGMRHEEPTGAPRGGHGSELSQSELLEKFDELAAHALGATGRAALADMVLALPSLRDARSILAGLSKPAKMSELSQG